MDLRKLAEAAMLDEVAKEVAGTHGGDFIRAVLERSDSEMADLAVKAACNLVVSAQNVVSAYFATYPLHMIQTKQLVEAELFSGMNLLWQGADGAFSTGTGRKDIKYPWDKGEPFRGMDNAVILTNFDTFAQLTKACTAALKRGGNAKVASEPAIEKVIKSLASGAEGGRTTAVLERCPVPQDANSLTVKVEKIAINLAAYSEGTPSKYESVLLSGLFAGD